MKISFDFDGTLEHLPMQLLAKKYIEAGIEVFITTTRRDKIKDMKIENKEVFDIAKKVGIPVKNINFTNFEDKYKFVREYDIHYDDDELEIELINEFPSTTVGLLYKHHYGRR